MEDTFTLISAGFLLYSYAAQTHDVYFLLGQENYHPEWPCSNRWCDFSGTRKSDETETECAARELLEETLHCVTLDDSDTLTPEYVMQLIHNKHYLCRILAYFPAHGFTPARKRICYVKEIPWQPDLPEIFAQKMKLYRPLNTLPTARDRLEYWHTLTPEQQNVPFVCQTQDQNTLIDVFIPPEWLEKSQLQWWSIPRLRGVIRNEGKYRKTYFRKRFLHLLRVILKLFGQVKEPMTSVKLQEIVHDVGFDDQVVLMATHIPWNNTEPLFVFDV